MKRSVESSKMLQWENLKWLSVQTFRLVYMYVYAGSHHDQQSSRDLMSSLAVANIIFWVVTKIKMITLAEGGG